jgi:hypothetical protein
MHFNKKLSPPNNMGHKKSLAGRTLVMSALDVWLKIDGIG